jgi:hypothetical protein
VRHEASEVKIHVAEFEIADRARRRCSHC